MNQTSYLLCVNEFNIYANVLDDVISTILVSLENRCHLRIEKKPTILFGIFFAML